MLRMIHSQLNYGTGHFILILIVLIQAMSNSKEKSVNLQFGISSKFSFMDLKEEELTLR